jgi:hypothetical protein
MKFPFVPAGIARRVARQLRRLGEDRRGNAFIIVAAAVVPMLALVGGGIDMSRGYLSRTRLQQACDAGVLATRKKLGATVVTNGVIPTAAKTTGERFFNLNYQDGAYGSTGRTFIQTFGSDYSINGVATVNVPTTLMRLFGSMNMPLSVTCTAQFNYANTDIMMVLDVTGSMVETNRGDSEQRIDVLKRVVKEFHEKIEKNKSQDVRIRYGFVPYSTNVNVGRLLKSGWMVSKANYETRTMVGSGTYSNPYKWRYETKEIDVSSLKGSSATALYKGGLFTYRMGGSSAPSVTMTYGGCIEERATYAITDYNNVNLSQARDLDIHAVPDSANPATQWRPLLPELTYMRSLKWVRDWYGRVTVNGEWGNSGDTTTDYTQPSEYGYAACPAPARKLATMPLTSSEFDDYVDDLSPGGSTYHDIGMIWGGRLLSPSGIFASENADVDGRETKRHLIFLTDGDTSALQYSYGAYGLEPLAKRRSTTNSDASLTSLVEKRFAFACDQVKKVPNTTVWVIGFGVTMNDLLTKCAGDGRWFQANNSAQLSDAFSAIAAAVGDLRISK